MQKSNKLIVDLLRKLKQILLVLLNSIIKIAVPVKKGRVYCVAHGGSKYSCNPKYISEYILEFFPDRFELIWPISNDACIENVDRRVKFVKSTSWLTIYYINTSEFIIANYRFSPHWTQWKKRNNQKYIMTWHGSMALKRIEFDARTSMVPGYLENALLDSRIIDLMLSDSQWCTEFTRRAFLYQGDILEKGLPRNDIFFDNRKMSGAIKKVLNYYKIKENSKIILYAPTFRDDCGFDQYILEWSEIQKAFEERFGSECVIMIRLHPAILSRVDSSRLVHKNKTIDVSSYNDMQELICAADVLITDYSSTMFEAAILRKPCFLYVPDVEYYNRGFYFQISELPFPYSINMQCLLENIRSFDNNTYVNSVDLMFKYVFKYYQEGTATENLVQWMLDHSVK